MRNFTKTLVAASLITATNAYSLGIGGIKLHSALNQNLNAEIGLMTSGETPDDISVKLAPPAKFDQAGIPWSYFLSKIKFNTVVKPNGAVVIKLTSTEALKEPFLDFLIEVTWPKGSLYREFTVLVEPPATYKQAVVPVISKPKTIESAPRPSRVISGLTPKPEVPSETIDDVEPITEYGPVRKTDTLFSIANRVKTDDVTAAQMAMAIYEANPDAFAKPNVNALIAGKTLNIPEPSEISKLTPTEASAQFRQHKRIWRGEIDREQQVKKVIPVKKAPVHPKEPVDVAEKPKEPKERIAKAKPEHVVPPAPKTTEPVQPEVNNQFKLEPPAEEVVSDKSVVAADGNKKEVTGTDGKLKGSSAAVKSQLEKDDKNLQERFEHMEKQLEMMQKMLEIKDEQLAAIQNQQGPTKSDQVQKDLETLASGTTSDTKPVEPKPIPPIEVKPESTLKTPEIAPAESAAETKVAPVPPTPPPAVKPKPVRVTPVPAPAEAVDPYMDLYLIAGGLATALLSGLGLFYWRKRKTDTRQETDMFAASSQITLPDDDEEVSVALVEDSSAYNVGMVSESAFLSEFTPSEFDAFETHQTEIDPISEADVYLAYGRYQQAEDLMRQAIHDFPDRDDCKLKLLEIFHANENKAAFSAFTKDLIKQGKKNNASFWAKVVELAEELSPDAAAILNQEGEFPFIADIVEEKELDVADSKVVSNPLEFDLTTFSVEDDLGSDDLSPFETPEQAFSTSTPFNRDNAKINEKSISSPAIDSTPDLVFANFDFDKSPPTEQDAFDSVNTISDAIDHSGNEIDFNLDTFSAEPKSFKSETSITQLDDDDNALDFDLSSFSTDTKTSLDKDEPAVTEEIDNGLDFDFSAFTTDNVDPDDNQEVLTDSDDFDLNAFEALSDSFKTEELEVFTENQHTNLDFASGGLKDKTISDQELLNDFEKFDFSGPDTLEMDDELIKTGLDEETLLKDFDFTATTKDAKNFEAPAQVLEDNEIEDFDFDFDFGLSDSENSDLSGKSKAGFDVGDLNDGDDALETKINLANAYIDMGDIETAKSIAEELMIGTAEQKQAAQEILKKIS